MTESKKKRGCLTGCLVAVAALVAIFVTLIVIGTIFERKFKTAASQYFETVKAGEFDKAYEMTASAFQERISRDEMVSFLSKSGLDRYRTLEWQGLIDAEDGRDAMAGTVELTDGTAVHIKVTAVSEEGETRIFSIEQYDPEEEARAKAEADREKADTKPAKRAGWSWNWSYSTATLSDPAMGIETANSQFLKTSEFAPETKELACRAKLSWAPPDTTVTGRWIFLGGPNSELKDYEILSDELKVSGNTPVTFTLIRGPKPLPLGSYVIRLFIDGKQKLEVPFSVKDNVTDR